MVAGGRQPAVGSPYGQHPASRLRACVGWILLRYTHRVAIGNRRILEVGADGVKFRWRDRAHGNRSRTMELPGVELLRRFLLHVLPRGFPRIRHYGLHANRKRSTKVAVGEPAAGRADAGTGDPLCRASGRCLGPLPCLQDRSTGRLTRQRLAARQEPKIVDTS